MLAELALDGASDVEGSQQADQPAPCAGDPQHSSAAGCGAAECLADTVLRLRSCLAAMMLRWLMRQLRRWLRCSMATVRYRSGAVEAGD